MHTASNRDVSKKSSIHTSYGQVRGTTAATGTAGAANFLIFCSFTSRHLHKRRANAEKKNTDLYFLVIIVTPPI